MDVSIEGKICSKCGEFKEYKFFYTRKGVADGYKSECMKCGRDLSTKWKEANKDKQTEYRKTQYLLKPNEERIKWKRGNPLGYLCNTAKANAKRYNREFSISKDQMLQKWEEQNGLCYYTGRPMKFDIGTDDAVSIDRVDSSKGYTNDNTVLCQYRINVMKNNIQIDELVSIAKDIVKTHDSKSDEKP